MSWDQPEFSFDQGQPPTPTRTPTSPSFGDAFQTPRLDSSLFDTRNGWNYGDASNATPNLLKTPRALLFGDLSGGSPAMVSKSSFGDQNANPSLSLNAEKLLSTPSFEALPSGQTPRFGQSPKPFASKGKETISQPELSLDTTSSFHSASSMQTPPPTTTSATKRKGQKADGSMHQAKSAANRRISVPLAPKSVQSTPQQAHAQTMSLGPLDLSPDLFGPDFGAPATAPPISQKLPWSNDTGDMDFFTHDSNIFDTPGQTGLDPFAFANLQTTSTNMMNSTMSSTQGLSVHNDFMASLHQSQPLETLNHGYGNVVDPNLLFSSPSKLPTPLERPGSSSSAIPQIHGISEASLQPYAYQIQEAQRTKAAAAVYAGVAKTKKRRKPSVDSPAVQAALETLRDDKARRPQMRRSITDSIVPTMNRHVHHRSNPSSHGRSSPEKPQRRHRHHRTSLALMIDENGKARTEARVVAESESGSDSDEIGDASDAMDLDDHSNDHSLGAASSSGSDSEPELPPPHNPARPRLGRFSHSGAQSHSQKSSLASMRSTSAIHSRPASFLQPLKEASFGKEDILENESAISDSELPPHPPEDRSGRSAQAELAKIMRRRESSRRGFRSPEGVFHSNEAIASNLSPTTVTDPDLTTPRSGGGIRCVCGAEHDEGQMVQCESCRNWLHVPCTGLQPQRLPEIYLCLFCTGSTPVARGGRVREPARMGYAAPSSPLAHKSRMR